MSQQRQGCRQSLLKCQANHYKNYIICLYSFYPLQEYNNYFSVFRSSIQILSIKPASKANIVLFVTLMGN